MRVGRPHPREPPNKSRQPTPRMKSNMDTTIKTWLESKQIIEKFITDLTGWKDKEILNQNSSALIARLAQADLLIYKVEETQDDAQLSR